MFYVIMLFVSLSTFYPHTHDESQWSDWLGGSGQGRAALMRGLLLLLCFNNPLPCRYDAAIFRVVLHTSISWLDNLDIILSGFHTTQPMLILFQQVNFPFLLPTTICSQIWISTLELLPAIISICLL